MSAEHLAAQLRARVLTPEEHQKRRDRAFEYEHRVKACLAKVHEDTWALAEALYEFDELNAWQLVGYETRKDFLAQPEVGLSERWYLRLVQMWRDLAVSRGVSAPTLRELEPSKVQEVLPAIRDGKVAVEDALADVQTLGWRDLRERYSQATIDAPLAAEEEPARVKCPICSTWVTEDKIIDGTARERGS